MTRTENSATLLILGAHGDLTHRLLLPGLATLLCGEPDRRVRLVGSDRPDISQQDWRDIVTDSFTTAKSSKTVLKRVLDTTEYVSGNVLDKESMQQILDTCSEGDGPLVIFFALPPAVTQKACEVLAELDVPASTRLALEKPFGSSAESATEFNRLLQRVVPEDHIFRIDHFLGVSTVLNLIGLRFANRSMMNVWNNNDIEKVEIVYDEDLALESRAGYYDNAGALRDMLQSHLLQVMSIFAMESIASLDAKELQEQKSQALRATRMWGGSAKRSSRRARYTTGDLDGRQIPSYVDEDGVKAENMTETLAEIRLEVNTNRWAGVPFYLRSGKALAEPRKQIVVFFKPVDHIPKGFTGYDGGDHMTINLKPGGVSLSMTMNAEGEPLDLERKHLKTTLAAPRMLPYGEVLGHILDGNQLLSVSADATVECWRIVDPILKAWSENQVPMEEYPAGSDGPEGWKSNDFFPHPSKDSEGIYKVRAHSTPSGAKKTTAKKSATS